MNPIFTVGMVVLLDELYYLVKIIDIRYNDYNETTKWSYDVEVVDVVILDILKPSPIGCRYTHVFEWELKKYRKAPYYNVLFKRAWQTFSAFERERLVPSKFKFGERVNVPDMRGEPYTVVVHIVEPFLAGDNVWSYTVAYANGDSDLFIEDQLSKSDKETRPLTDERGLYGYYDEKDLQKIREIWNK